MNIKMETRLQSSEVRIPKNDGFDFQSSYARSLSFNNTQSQSLDFELSFRIANNNCDSPSSSPTVTPASAPPPLNMDQVASTTPKRRYTSNNVRGCQQDASKHKSLSAEIEVLRLRKECQSLIEENRRLMRVTAGNNRDDLKTCDSSVEEVILQSQVDTLQWQLKQVESSQQMYHAVMEEVVRFLERCHQSLDAIQKSQIARSKSVNHVYGKDSENNKSRTRTSTNTMKQQQNVFEPNDTIASSTESYSNFRDFTWRRSPKNNIQPFTDNIELDPDKLSQEAFRLLRTTQNLLLIKEPVLSDAKIPLRNSLDLKKTTCSTLQRKLNSRESRLSIQSSTDDSVHSTSSSRNETDEEILSQPSFCILPSSAINRKHLAKSVASSVDDESGFSSMNSFQDIGLPTALMSNHLSSSDKSEDSQHDTIVENRESALKYFQFPAKKDASLPILHRRWSSAPPLPPKRNLSTFTPHCGDEALKVLWV